MQVLAFRLHGLAASWGTVEAGVERRPSSRDPGGGAILGLLAAALGIRRDQTERHLALGESLRIAVCGHGARRLVQDYRTVQTVEPLRRDEFLTRGEALRLGRVHTLTGWRQHVEDGLWRVFVAAGEDQLRQIEAALLRPVFELYLGRREHPLALPPDPRLIFGGLTEALRGYDPAPPVTWEGRGDHDLHGWITDRICGAEDGDLWWDPGFPGAPAGNGRLVVDQPVSRDGWRFRSREQRWGKASRFVAADPAEQFFDAEDGK
jgi:CRISPR system Cascade subunit CasD